jgi:hypothetical protein
MTLFDAYINLLSNIRSGDDSAAFGEASTEIGPRIAALEAELGRARKREGAIQAPDGTWWKPERVCQWGGGTPSVDGWVRIDRLPLTSSADDAGATPSTENPQ